MRSFALTVAPLIVGCGMSMGSGNGPNPADYQNLNAQTQASVEAHRSASATIQTQTGCRAELERYGAETSPMLDRMASMSTDMDACMSSMGLDPTAPLEKGCDGMRTEMQRHLAAACASTDVALIREEATRHCDAMESFLEGESDRVAGMMSSHRMGTSSMMNGMCGR